MKIFYITIGGIFYLLRKVFNRFIAGYQKYRFAKFGKDIYIGDNCRFTEKNIYLGNHIYIGSLACFQSTHGQIQIDDNVMFGPGVHIHGGNHKYDLIGQLMINNHKTGTNIDGKIHIQEDVWIGANAIILKGVTIGKGSVIGAGCVISRDIEPYSVVVGNKVREIHKRFSDKQLIEHQTLIQKNEY